MDARRLIARVPHFRFRASAYWPIARTGEQREGEGLIKEGFVKEAWWWWVCFEGDYFKIWDEGYEDCEIFEDRMKFDIIFFYDFSFFFYRSRRFRKIDISIKWFRFHFDFHNRFNRLLNLWYDVSIYERQSKFLIFVFNLFIYIEAWAISHGEFFLNFSNDGERAIIRYL